MWRSAGRRPQLLRVAVLCLLAARALAVAGAQRAAEEGAPASRAVFTDYFRQLSRERRAVGRPAPSGAPPKPAELLTADDVFVSVKTTSKYHRGRLELLLDTWIANDLQHVSAHLINTNCSAAHSRQALSCKMAAEYDAFLDADRKWFCHVDDDNYLNMGALLRLLSQYSHTQDVYIGRPSLEHPLEATETGRSSGPERVVFWFATGGAGFCLSRGLAIKMGPWARDGAFLSTAERIRLPDDRAVGYIVGAMLGVGLTRSPLFHSHLESLALLTRVHEQVPQTRSFSKLIENHHLFKCVHCVLHPHTPWCQR
uniref:Beta-1,3-N-acetylglucosaminyltransferase lunatic fringe-like n=1 Tax=Hippocampus comes TaxID=109280 RepID=A0A3Q2XX08_HIPCM